MPPNRAAPEEYFTQWCNGNYELMHSCLQQLCKADYWRKAEDLSCDSVAPAGGFWSRFWHGSRSRDDESKDSPTVRPKAGVLPVSREGGDADVRGSRASGQAPFPSEGHVSDDALEKLRSSVVAGFRQFPFYRPHLIPNRKVSVGLDNIRNYIREKFADLERSIDEVDSFSMLSNVDQYLCCELLYEGICYYSDESQTMSEFTIIENMLYAQSEYQLRCLKLLFRFINGGKTLSDSKVCENAVFPECVTILRELLSKGLIKNVLLLLMSSTKEACRYKTMLSGDSSSAVKTLYDHTVDLVNSLLGLLEECFLRFQPARDDIKGLIMLLPHIFNLKNLYGISDYGGALSAFFDGLSDGSSAWYPASHIVASLCVGVREFDQISNNACNMGNRMLLIVLLSLDPHIYRLSCAEVAGAQLEATPMSATDSLNEFKPDVAPFVENHQCRVLLEFFIFGIYLNDMERAIKCIDSGVFVDIVTVFLDTTPIKESGTVIKILELLLRVFLFSNNTLSKLWYDILDYEVLCKRAAEDRSRVPFTGTVDEQVYRPPGRSLIELLTLLRRFESSENKRYAFQAWKSCAEAYRSLIPSVNCHLYKHVFDNPMYNCSETNAVDKKLVERLLVPCDGFSWWERNSALLDLVTLAAGDQNIYVETYPRLLTTLLDFALYLSTIEDVDGECGGHIVGRFLNTGASRELRFPFLLERLISQIGSLTKGCYDTLPGFIYERLLARDDQIETAEAALVIASTIQSQHSQQGLNVGHCLRKMYTFPLISGIPEVKIALSTLGLGGRCPFGLIETSIVAFKLISQCDRIPKGVQLRDTPELYLDVNIQHKMGSEDQSFLNSVFSILSRSHMDGLEMLTSSVLSSLCSNHIKDSATASAALLRISELLRDSKGRANRGFVDTGYRLSVEELRAYVNCVRILFVYLPRGERFSHSGTDWLHRLVEFAIWILDTHCFRNECVHWGLIGDVFDFLEEVVKGPFGGGNASKASQYLLEQFLQPASSICVSLVRAAWESNILSAISIICILFKRDILLVLAHRAAMFMYTNREGSHCPNCSLPYVKDSELRRNSIDGHMDVDAPSGPLNWWSSKIRKINSIFSSIHSRASSISQNTCECLQLDMQPLSLLMAHDAVIEAMNTLHSKGDCSIDLTKHCDFLGFFKSSASDELRMKSVYLLLQLQERVGIESLFVSGKVLKELQTYYSLLHPCEEFPTYVMYQDMESEDMLLYNKVASVVTNFNRMDSCEHFYYCMSHLCDLNRCGIDSLVLFLLKQCSIKSSLANSENNFGYQLLGRDNEIISLIRLASGGGELWQFHDWRRMDALASLLLFAKSSHHVLKLVAKHWRSIDDDTRKLDFVHLSYESYIMQCQRLSYLLQLLVLIAERSSEGVIFGDSSHFLKIYYRLVKIMCDMTRSMHDELDSLVRSAILGKGLDVKVFLNMWKHASFPSNVCLTFDLQLATKLLNPQSCDHVQKEMNVYALRVNLSNMVLTSSTALITSILRFISHCKKLNVQGISEKSRSWLEFASAEFDPDETSELKLALQIALIKQLGHLWIESNVDLHANNSLLSISIILKLLSFILTHETSSQLRSKVYACVNLFFTNHLRHNGPTVSELVVAHLLSNSSDAPISSMSDRSTLLQLLWSDVTTSCNGDGFNADGMDFGKSNLDDENVMAGASGAASGPNRERPGHVTPKGCYSSPGIYANYDSNGLTQLFVGQDYGFVDLREDYDIDLHQLISLERIHGNERLFIAVDCGVRTDYRVEALTLLNSILSALHKFEAGAVEYELGTVSYGSLGVISASCVSSLLQQRLLGFKRCKQCLLHSLCCPLCLKLLTGTARVLKAASGLQQFSTFWFHVQPTSPDTCLVDLFLSCDLLLGFSECESFPTELFHPFISTLENLLCMPSVKSRNALIKWLNRHSELLGSCMSLNLRSASSDDEVSLVSSLLRIYRICLLWLLAEYRRANFQSEPLNNFSLILADLQCKFPLAMTMPRSVPALLDTLTMELSTSSDCCWQCILLGLQSIFPELGAFESDLDFSGQTPIKALAVEKAATVATVLTRCGSALLSFINHLNMLDPTMRRKSLGRFALRIATVECAAMLLEYILALVATQGSAGGPPQILLGLSATETTKDILDKKDMTEDAKTLLRPSDGAATSVLVPKLRKFVDLSRVELLLDNIARLCGDNGVRLTDSVGSRRKHVFGDQLVEYLAPYDLEHVPSFGNVQQYTYSYTTLYGLLLSSICNLAIVLERYYGCKFSSPLLSREHLKQ
ncbi:uncharacterized protein BXIN_0732 [Babesia sp. Xinjiang]|uniref:uncharacterized protein n=1 Tax=Babesia sp. Xinjiang TaxID=462227 RepID=UPI000A251CEB|nr:uncharacterized protein BXIN_0667 [Babesia sp. Xinjiang]XP_028872621.1 uncharacterized protein BXIN_0732 [Babesia sp. Xinjiang]ORM42116.1 hypothetical protein BXIN_0667 [Babesia sp. Xinjiang]ORM42165.1 hypothetical protein BXIN_0732 [Babesia sp. Xinjiang]